MTSDEFSDIEQLDENLRKWFKEKWVRFGPDGKIRGACARGDDSEGKPKCLPQKKAQNLGKKGRKYAASKKRREDPNPERRGKAKNVATKKKTNEDIPFNECPSCRGPIVHESMMTEKKDACYHKVKSRYKVWPSAYASGALVQCRKKGASNWGTGGKKNESNIMKGIVNEEEYVLTLYVDGKPLAKYGADQEARKTMERLQAKFPNKTIELKREIRGGVGGNEKVGEAANPAQQAAIAINMKKKGQKPKNVDEAKAKPYVKPFIENGKQVGWKSSDGYHVKYWQMFAKDSAIKHAKISPAEVDEAVDWQRGAYNDEHDHTFSDAEEYLAHLYPVVKKYMIRRAEVGFRAVKNMNYLSSKNPMDHLDDKQFLNSKAHINNVDAAINYLGLVKLPMMSGSKQATSSIGYTWTTFLSPNKKAAVMYVQDRGMGQDMIYIAAVDKTLHRKIYDLFVDAGVIVGRDKKLQEPELPDAMRVSNATNRDEAFKKAMDKFYNKTDDKDVNEDYTGEFAAEKTPAINPYGGLKDNQFRGAISETPTDNPTGASGEGGWRKYKPKPAGQIEEDEKLDAMFEPTIDKLHDLVDYKIKNGGITLTDDPYEDISKILLGLGLSKEEALDYALIDAILDKMEDNGTYDELWEDTAYAGGMGQGGNAGESYRKFKPKSAGTFKEDELDEACWKGYHKEGNKKMFGKTYPNCVKNTNEEEQLDEKCWDTHKQVGMKNKGGKQVPNCVPKESAIMKGLKSL